MEDKLSFDPDRRRFVAHCAVAVGALCGGCSLLDEPEIRICTLDELAQTGWRSIDFNGDRLFVTTLDGKLTCLDLTCTHKRCTVKYYPEVQHFICPCHKGKYDRAGKVLSGKPPRPLRRLKVETRGNDIWVLNQAAE